MDCSQGQQAPSLSGMLGPHRQASKPWTIKITAQSNRNRHDESPLDSSH
jgi:hypothetical protein